MDLILDRASNVPIFAQIAAQLRTHILGGLLPEGFRLPPERRLAESLGVSRTTVLAAYRALKDQGLIDACVGRGTQVRGCTAHAAAADGRTVAGLPWGQLLRGGGEAVADPLIRDLLALAERHDVISLSVGLPASDLLPVAAVRDALDRVMARSGALVLQHCPTEGHTPLRESLASWFVTRQIRCRPDEVIVLSGSQQGLDLLARQLLSPGDTVIVEEPSYLGALHVFRRCGVRLVAIPMDSEGLRTDLLAEAVDRHRPQLIYTLPTFQNPSGAVMSLERRQELLTVAARAGVPVLEDDPYVELRYDGPRLPSLKALDRDGVVLHLGTFSKVLSPGLRLGYLVAPRPVIRALTLLKQGTDLHTASVGQWVLDLMLRENLVEPHLARIRPVYRERRDAMLAALEEHLGDRLQWTRPDGGFYVWARSVRPLHPSALLAAAADEGVSVLPGETCFAQPPDAAYLRLAFSNPEPDRIRTGIARLAAALSRIDRGDGDDASPRDETRPLV